jgi:hypothetical protein
MARGLLEMVGTIRGVAVDVEALREGLLTSNCFPDSGNSPNNAESD